MKYVNDPFVNQFLLDDLGYKFGSPLVHLGDMNIHLMLYFFFLCSILKKNSLFFTGGNSQLFVLKKLISLHVKLFNVKSFLEIWAEKSSECLI